MTAGDGRPRSEKRQRNRASLVRMNEAEYQALIAASAAAGMAPSTYLREAFLAGQNEAAIRADERARIRSLLPYNINCCDGFPAAVADLIGEHGDG